MNKLRGVFNVVITKAPSFGDNQKAMIQDIALVNGATLYTKDFNMDLKEISMDDLGRASKIIVKKDDTTNRCQTNCKSYYRNKRKRRCR